MFTANTVDIKRMLVATLPIRTDAKVKVIGDTLTVLALNQSDSAMCSISISVESNKDVTFNMDGARLSSMMKGITSTKCMFEVTDVIEVTGGKTTFVSEKLAKAPAPDNVVKVPEGLVLAVNGKDLNDYVEALKVLDDIVSFRYDTKKLMLVSEKELSNEKMNMEFDIISVERDDVECRTDFMYTMISPLTKALSGFKKVVISFSDWSMMSLKGADDDMSVEFFIAPSVGRKP